MTQTKRLTRKELRGPDEFQTLSMRALEWARENPRTVWIAGGSALAALVLIAVAIGIVQSRAHQATQEFYGASELFKRQQWSEALSSFTQIADDYARAIEDDIGEPVLLHGTSTGGSVSLQLAVDRPELVRRLVLAASACRLSREGRDLMARVSRRSIR